ncbi:RNA-binding protein [Anaerostipes sp. 494a]|uniref:CAT RNA binding domain-containing protein n=1 Tax=Anaerostipes TaxID=207244 RepID=UPI000952BA5B|nr:MULTISPECIES: CAT RNA binding domain-containing protein [Anaerostipes]MCI5623807.1 PRD domain-containing protein [Anaerostipes sp.]MDY2727331.1 CAT RNA binding domain-containing protein [Anaerostipes faecalis]OLR58783.1 RNA-binding protein [Anaerostipes sp. 494a]
MIIQKVINNNVVSTFDTNNREVILMGKGIGFRKKAGDELDKNKIEKIFTLDQRANSPFVQEVMAIIQEFYEIPLNPENPSYQRFATHLEYLESGIRSQNYVVEEDEEDDVEFYERNQKKYPEAYVCSQKIVEHIEGHYQCKLSADEKMYLIIYVKRLILEIDQKGRNFIDL